MSIGFNVPRYPLRGGNVLAVRFHFLTHRACKYLYGVLLLVVVGGAHKFGAEELGVLFPTYIKVVAARCLRRVCSLTDRLQASGGSKLCHKNSCWATILTRYNGHSLVGVETIIVVVVSGSRVGW